MKGSTGQRVLVVEDEYLVAQTYRIMLRGLGHEVVGPAASSRSALEILEREAVDVALLDVMLRGQKVTPVARRLRELGIPFAFLTGLTDVHILDGEFAGAPVLAKPTPEDTLAEVIQDLL